MSNDERSFDSGEPYSRIDNLEEWKEDTEVYLIRQEHRTVPLWQNLWKYRKGDGSLLGKRKTKAARLAVLFWWLIPSGGSVVVLGGSILAFLTLWTQCDSNTIADKGITVQRRSDILEAEQDELGSIQSEVRQFFTQQPGSDCVPPSLIGGIASASNSFQILPMVAWEGNRSVLLKRKSSPSRGKLLAFLLGQPFSAECIGKIAVKGDFRFCDLQGMRINEGVSQNLMLDNGVFQDADLSRLKFYQLKARSGDFRGATLFECDFYGGDFSGADFTGASLTHVDFSGCIFKSATLVDVQCDDQSNFSGADCRGADLDSAFVKSFGKQIIMDSTTNVVK